MRVCTVSISCCSQKHRGALSNTRAVEVQYYGKHKNTIKIKTTVNLYLKFPM